MKLYIKNSYVQQKPGLFVYDDKGEKKYSLSIEHNVLGMKLDLYNSVGKRVAKIRQHGFSFNKTYNITAGKNVLKLILKVEENNIVAFIKGNKFAIVGDILKKDFALLDENKDVIMFHKSNIKNYYELDIIQEKLELLSISISVCIETLLFFNEKKSQNDKNFFAKYILNEKKMLGSLQENFSTNLNKVDKIKNKD